ncbi:MAG: hypothetical protein JNK47_02685 [Mesorhizobium sp.]|nr:hypothetical protein [Mesorhizobium sp.]MBL8576108.1 hypothetical protein [Mesorhizobium sp.]
MRNMLAFAAIAVFVVSTGLLEVVRVDQRPMTSLPPAMGDFGTAKVDPIAVTSVIR